jgi:hypothetical protein
MAETKGFEPSRRFPAYSLSRGAPSTTRPRFRRLVYLAPPRGTRGELRKNPKRPKNVHFFLRVKKEVHHIPVLNDIGFAFDT